MDTGAMEEAGNDDGGLRLASYRVGSLPTVYYIPDYVPPQEQLLLLHQVHAAPTSKWKTLKNRRLQNWGGVVHEKGLLPQELPPWLSALTGKISDDLRLFPSPLNHVLINEYLPGQGIMPHQDGPAYFPVVAIVSLGSPAVMQFIPHQSVRSVGGDDQPNLKKISVVLMPGSLLVFKDSAYQDYLHGIDECFEHKLDDSVVNLDKLKLGNLKSQGSPILNFGADTECAWDSLPRDGARISLTCRLVLRVLKNLIKL